MGEFAKLIHPGGALVELDECRINRGQVQRGIRAAKTSKARESCGRGMDRQQMNDAATKRLDDVRQLAGEIAQLAGGWNDGEVFFVELLELNFEFFVARGRQIFRRTKKPGEGAINCIGGAGKIGMNTNADVLAIGPMLPAPPGGVEQI